MPLLNAPPYAWSDANGQAQGLYPDIAVALAKVTGLEINIDVVPFARAARTVADGSADATLHRHRKFVSLNCLINNLTGSLCIKSNLNTSLNHRPYKPQNVSNAACPENCSRLHQFLINYHCRTGNIK